MVIPVFAHTTYNIFNYLFLVQCYSRGSTKKGPSAFLDGFFFNGEELLVLNKRHPICEDYIMYVCIFCFQFQIAYLD